MNCCLAWGWGGWPPWVQNAGCHFITSAPLLSMHSPDLAWPWQKRCRELCFWLNVLGDTTSLHWLCCCPNPDLWLQLLWLQDPSLYPGLCYFLVTAWPFLVWLHPCQILSKVWSPLYPSLVLGAHCLMTDVLSQLHASDWWLSLTSEFPTVFSTELFGYHVIPIRITI